MESLQKTLERHIPMSQESPSPGSGALVEVRGDTWRVVETVEHEGCRTCHLVGTSPSNAGVRQTLLLPFDRPRSALGATRLQKVGRRRWMAALRALAATRSEFDCVRGAAEAKIDLLDYQLEPAIACARGAARILLADEVGLGKTIQAGLVLADLRARDESARALVLCPAGLCSQWRHELRDRFGINPELLDRPAVRRLASSSAAAGPWEQVSVAVASVDFVKQPEVLRGMGADDWDLLVIDEAHLCALAPERAAAVAWLAGRSRRVVLLTATPHSGEPGAFEALCGIGRLPGEGPVLMFRRTRADLGLPVERHCHILRITLSAAERRLHRLLERYTALVWRAVAAGYAPADARLAMIVLRKRAVSGTRALLASLMRRRSGLASAGGNPVTQMPLTFDDDGCEASDEEPGLVLSVPGLADGRSERLVLDRLVDLARSAVATDAKCGALARLLRRVREPAIVFTEYRDTLAHVAELCAERDRVAVIHGGMDRHERADAVRAFNRGAADLLLATDAAAHGLNLQARCRLVVSLELPWNPVRLEQRIGRVDRIGQKRAVHATHLVARKTGEELVLARLALRLSRMRQALGSAGSSIDLASEEDVAQAVFTWPSRDAWARFTGGEQCRRPESAQEAASGGLAVTHRFAAAARDQVEKLQQVRRLLPRTDSTNPARILADLARSGCWWTTLRLRGPARASLAASEVLPRGAVLVLFEAETIDGCGLLVERSLAALVAPPVFPCPPLQDAIPALLGPGSLTRAAFEQRAADLAAARLRELVEARRPSVASVESRERATARAKDRIPAVACQPGLFDRRALRVLDEERLARLEREQERAERAAALTRAATATLAAPPRLVLAAVLVT